MSQQRRAFPGERLADAVPGAVTSNILSSLALHGASPPSPALVQAGLLLGQLINAVYNVLAQVVSKDGAHPIVFSLYRDACAAPVLFLAAWYFDGAVRLPRQDDVPRVVAQGFLGVFCNQILFLYGVKLTNATVAAIVNLTLPLFAAAIAVGLGMEPFRSMTGAGIVLAVGGAMFMKAADGVSHGGTSEHASASGWGMTVVLVGAFASAVYYVMQKPTLARYPPVTVTAWEYAVGCAFMACAAWTWVPAGTGAMDDGAGGDAWVLTRGAIVALAFSVIFNSVAKYAITAFCNKHVGVIVLTVWSTTTPVFTALLSALFLGTPPRWSYLGMLPIVAGTLLVTKSRADAAKEKEQGG